MYKHDPIEITGNGIPIFSPDDFYIENYNKISKDHLDHFEKTGKNPFMDENHWKSIEQSTLEIVKPLLNSFSKEKEKPKVLDVGVGLGRLLEELNECEKYGMDISLKYLNYAKQKGIEVCKSKIEDMPYCDNFFDIILCTDVLEHVLDLNHCISKILNVLKVGGHLVIRVPYKEDLSSYLLETNPYEFVHLRNFDESSLLLLFKKIFGLKPLTFQLAGKRSVNENTRTGLLGKLLNKLCNLYDKPGYLFTEINYVFTKLK